MTTPSQGPLAWVAVAEALVWVASGLYAGGLPWLRRRAWGQFGDPPAGPPRDLMRSRCECEESYVHFMDDLLTVRRGQNRQDRWALVGYADAATAVLAAAMAVYGLMEQLPGTLRLGGDVRGLQAATGSIGIRKVGFSSSTYAGTLAVLDERSAEMHDQADGAILRLRVETLMARVAQTSLPGWPSSGSWSAAWRPVFIDRRRGEVPKLHSQFKGQCPSFDEDHGVSHYESFGGTESCALGSGEPPGPRG